MVYKTPNFSKESGMTYIDVIVSLSIILIVAMAILIIIDPLSLQKRGRDNKRISDLFTLERAILEYGLTTKYFPDTADVTRYSNVLPTGNNGPFAKASDGWIDTNLTQYLPSLPIDPINDNTYRYIYKRNTNSFELNATLEYFLEKSNQDGGDDSNFYELGNDLTIL